MKASNSILDLLAAIARIDEQALGKGTAGGQALVGLEILAGRELLIRALAQECKRSPEAAIAEFEALRAMAANTDRIYLGLVAERSLLASQLSEAEMQLRQLKSFGESAGGDDLLLNRLA